VVCINAVSRIAQDAPFWYNGYQNNITAAAESFSYLAAILEELEML
jgi:hypothetical protein